MKKTTDPPRLAIWLLTRRLSAEWRDFVVGDLEEEFATRSDDSPVAAHTWLWWQTVRCLAAPPPVRPNPLPLGSSQGDSRMRTLFADFRYASRMMSRTPSFAVAVVSVLALGIGANTAIFSLVNSLLLRSLPVPDSDRLAIVADAARESPAWSNAIWEQIRQRRELFAGALAWSPNQFNLARGGEAQLVEGLWASGEFFEVLGVRAVLGRTFTAADDRRGGGPDGPVAVISDDFWRRYFGGSPDVIGRPLMLGSLAFTAIGVTPPGFFGPEVGRRFDLVVPIGTEPLLRGADSALDLRGRSWLGIQVRRNAGQSLDAATAGLRGVQQQVRDATLPDPRFASATVVRW